MTTPTRAEMCADLARAMGWTTRERIPGITKIWLTPDGIYSPSGCPDPFTIAADKDALVAWIAKDDERWARFSYILWSHLPKDFDFDYIKAFALMPLPVIAELAWRAI